MLADGLLREAERLLAACRARGVTLATVESCTGGLIAAALTAVARSSDVFDCGFVTYSNVAKHDLVGVPLSLIAECGAVSEGVARAMAQGGLDRSSASIAVSVTGVAGPGGGSALKPVGLVCFGLAQTGQATIAVTSRFAGDRAAIRAAAVSRALALIHQALETDRS